MVGRKTRDQQQRIIENKVGTTDADPDFDPRPGLKASDRRETRMDDRSDGE